MYHTHVSLTNALDMHRRHCTLTQLPVLCTLLLLLHAVAVVVVAVAAAAYIPYDSGCSLFRARSASRCLRKVRIPRMPSIAFRSLYDDDADADSITPNCMMFQCTLN